MQRRQFISVSAAGALLPIAGTFSQAHATVTTKPSRMVVGFTAGGGTYTIARMVADSLRPDYPGGLIVENKLGRPAASRWKPSRLPSRTAVDAILRSDIERWGPVVKASGFKAED